MELISRMDGNVFHGLVVGPTSNSKLRYLNSLKKKISELGINKSITFTGSRNDITNIYKISDIVFVCKLPSVRITDNSSPVDGVVGKLIPL